MATLAAISVEDFLALPDNGLMEYLDGEIVERPLSSKSHNRAIANLIHFFRVEESRLRIYGYPTQHIPVNSRRYRVPDFVAYADSIPEGEIPAEPPLIVVEVLSPSDTLSSIRDRFAEYREFGVRHIYLADPAVRTLQRHENGSLLQVDAIDIPSHGFRLAARMIFE